ncbi:MAG: N,N'-diacetylchitobiose phosphorylase, partial [Bacteroidota bacterium]
MQYGYFDDENKEYVITKPDTPRSWSNYIGDTKYGGVITNNAGGYSFYKSAGQGRITRFRFNSIPMDQPGRYIYLRDKENKDYWSGSWQPVGKPLDKYKSEVRFGSGYATFLSEYNKIKSNVKYFVPLNAEYECWLINVKNDDSEKRNLSLFSYVEYPGNWNANDDLLNLQYTQYTVKMNFIDGIIDHGTNILLPEMPENFAEKDQGRHTFLAAVGADIIGYDTDREKFLGRYRTYANPKVVEDGATTNSIAESDNACGVLQLDIELEPGESKDLLFILGIGKADVEGKKIVEKYSDITNAEKELDDIKEHWHSKIEKITVETPDAEFNSMFNMWNPYNNLITFSWSRAASLIYTADERDGLGYRDSVQDLLGIIPHITEDAKERLELMITGQCSSGGAMPVIKPHSHKPGYEKLPKESEYRSDDCMWLFNAIPEYVKETGDIDFYTKILPYADQGEDTVHKHLKRAIEFNLERSGANGFPAGLTADWNDCLEFGDRGESIFVAFQLRYALKNYIVISDLISDSEEVVWGKDVLEKLDASINKTAWDGKWYLRALRSGGVKFGSQENEEGSIFMNPQAWAIISGHTKGDRATGIMEEVHKRLSTQFGIQVCDPPYKETDHKVVKARYMNSGSKENAGIFQHTQGWAIIAETMLGHGNRAFDYYKAYLPSAYNDKAEIRETEPYVYCQSTFSKYSPRFGKSRVPWLTGTATWAYYAA